MPRLKLDPTRARNLSHDYAKWLLQRRRERTPASGKLSSPNAAMHQSSVPGRHIIFTLTDVFKRDLKAGQGAGKKAAIFLTPDEGDWTCL